MELINRLIEQRARIWEQMKALNDLELNGERSLDAEERAQWDRMNSEVSELDARIRELEDIETRNKAADEQRARYEKAARPSDEGKRSSNPTLWDRFLRGEVRTMDIDLRGMSRSLNPHNFGWEVRDLNTTDDAGIVPASFRAVLYQHLIENSAIRQTNATILTTTSGEALEVPKTTTHGTAAIVGEGTAIAEAEPVFSSATLGAYKIATFTQATRELAEDSGVDFESYLAADFGRALGNRAGLYYITGSGTNQPEGVMAVAGTGVTGTGTASAGPTTANLMDLFYSVIPSYRRNGYWLMENATEGVIRKLADTTGQYLWQPGLQAGTPSLLLGRPVIVDPGVAAIGTGAKPIAFGDFSGFFIRDVAGIRVERSDDFAFTTDLTTWKAVLRTDSKLVDLTGAVKVFNSGTVT